MKYDKKLIDYSNQKADQWFKALMKYEESVAKDKLYSCYSSRHLKKYRHKVLKNADILFWLSVNKANKSKKY